MTWFGYVYPQSSSDWSPMTATDTPRNGERIIVAHWNTVVWEYDIVYYDVKDKNYPWHSIVRYNDRYPDTGWLNCWKRLGSEPSVPT